VPIWACGRARTETAAATIEGAHSRLQPAAHPFPIKLADPETGSVGKFEEHSRAFGSTGSPEQ